MRLGLLNVFLFLLSLKVFHLFLILLFHDVGVNGFYLTDVLRFWGQGDVILNVVYLWGVFVCRGFLLFWHGRHGRGRVVENTQVLVFLLYFGLAFRNYFELHFLGLAQRVHFLGREHCAVFPVLELPA